MTKVNDFVSDITQGESAVNTDTVDNLHASDLAQSTHIHDDRYYTETEVDTLLSTSMATPAYGSHKTANNLIYYYLGSFGRLYIDHSQS